MLTFAASNERKYKQVSMWKLTIMAEIAERVKSIIVEKLAISESEVTPEATFAQDLGADSLETAELLMDMEKAFDIKIPDEETEKIQTVGDAIKYIEDAQANA